MSFSHEVASLQTALQFDEMLLTRFRIESRGLWGRTTASCLVVYDTWAETYLKTGYYSGRAYAHFSNSFDVFEFIKAGIRSGDISERR